MVHGERPMKILYVIKNPAGYYLNKDGSWTPDIEQAKIYNRPSYARVRIASLQKQWEPYPASYLHFKDMAVYEIHITKEVKL